MAFFPAPAPRPGSGGRGAPVVGGGVVKATEPTAFLNADDANDYQQGYDYGASGAALRPGTWWFRQGWFEANQKLPRRTLAVGFPAEPYRQLAPVEPEEVALYEQGYADGLAGSTVPGPPEWWYKYGRADGRYKRPKFGLIAGQPPPLFPIVLDVAPAPTPGQLAVKWPVFELAASWWGRRIPYDFAVQVERFNAELPGLPGALLPFVQAGISFDFLDGSPFEDDDEGYGIGGPNGRLAREISRLANLGKINPNPNFYGLPAWVGAYRKRGAVRILSALELKALGLYEDLLRLVPLET